MSNSDWINNPEIKNISPEKLALLIKLVEESRNKKSQELIPFFISATSKASADGIQFNDTETEVILSVLKERMSKEDIKKIDTIRKFSEMIAKKK